MLPFISSHPESYLRCPPEGVRDSLEGAHAIFRRADLAVLSMKASAYPNSFSKLEVQSLRIQGLHWLITAELRIEGEAACCSSKRGFDTVGRATRISTRYALCELQNMQQRFIGHRLRARKYLVVQFLSRCCWLVHQATTCRFSSYHRLN